MLTAYCNMLHILRPAKAPGFAYAWLEIVSHRVFMGRILATTPQQKVTESNVAAAELTNEERNLLSVAYKVWRSVRHFFCS